MKKIPFVIWIICSLYPMCLQAEILAEQKKEQIISSGVVYEQTELLNEEGFVRAHLLQIDLQKDNVSIRPVESKKEIHLKENLGELLRDNGAIAGINGDFFGLKGVYSQSFGLVVKDGKIINANANMNEKPRYANFFIDKNNEAFIDFFNLKMDLYINGVFAFPIAGINKTANPTMPTLLSAEMYQTTKPLDDRIKALVKIIIREEQIVYVSSPGENITLGNDDIVLSISETSYLHNAHKLVVGNRAILQMQTNIDLDQIEQAIGGGALLVQNGQASKTGEIVSEKNRTARSMLGISADRKKIYLAVIEKSKDSLGMTHAESADFMVRVGANYAMHLDGGGSSSLITSHYEETNLHTENALSDGVERKIINGIGIFDETENQAKKAQYIRVKTDYPFALTNVSQALDVFILDENYRLLEKNPENLSITSTHAFRYENHRICFLEEGNASIQLQYGDLQYEWNFSVHALQGIRPEKNAISVDLFKNQEFTILGFDKENRSQRIHPSIATFFVSHPEALKVEGSSFQALQAGRFLLQAALGDAKCELLVNAGNHSQELLLENAVLEASQKPKQKNALPFAQHQKNTSTAQLIFNQLPLPAYVYELQLQLTGVPVESASLKAVIADVKGTETSVYFTKNLNFTSRKTLTIAISDQMPAPLYLKRIVLEVPKGKAKGEIILHQLTAKSFVGEAIKPQNIAYKDYKQTKLGNKIPGQTDIHMIADLTNKSAATKQQYSSLQQQWMNQANRGASLLIANGNCSDLNFPSSILWKRKPVYDVRKAPHVTIISLTAQNEGLRKSDKSQWKRLQQDLLFSQQQNVLLLIDKAPQNFAERKEFQLFHELLKNCGKNVAVVSHGSEVIDPKVMDGIRYLHVSSVWNASGEKKNGFGFLAIRFSEHDFNYEFISL